MTFESQMLASPGPIDTEIRNLQAFAIRMKGRSPDYAVMSPNKKRALDREWGRAMTVLHGMNLVVLNYVDDEFLQLGWGSAT